MVADETGTDGMTSADDNSISSLLRNARGHLGHRRFDLAVDVATEAIRLDPRRSETYVIRAEALRKLNKADRALADLALAIRLDPDRPAPYVIRAEIYRKRCLLDQAIVDATQAIFLDPNNAAAFSIRASCRQSIGDVQGAGADQEELFRIDPTRPVPGPDAGAPAGASASAMDPDEERIWKRSGVGRRDDPRGVIAEGSPVDTTYRSRPMVRDEDAPEALGAASGYKPEVVARPLPRARHSRRPSRGWSPLGILLLGGVCALGGVLLVVRLAGVQHPPTADPPGKTTLSSPTSSTRGGVRVSEAGQDSDAVQIRPMPPAAPAVGGSGTEAGELQRPGEATGSQPGATEDTPTGQSLRSLDGMWLAFTEEAGGKRISGGEMLKKRKTLKVEGDRFTLSTTYYKITGTIEPVPSEGRFAIDLTGRYVEGGDGKDVLLRAIFEIRRGDLWLCYTYNDDGPHHERPTGFVTEEGRPGLCVAFRRLDGAPNGRRPALVGLTELSADVPEFAPWLSGDGREIFWTTQAGPGQEMWVWSARRKGPGSPFGGVRRLFAGGVPTLTGDGLTLVLIDRANRLLVASRASAEAPFGEPSPIESLRREGVRYKSPCLSGNGLTLYFERSEGPGEPWEFCSSRRAGPRDAWGPPEPVPFVQAGTPVVPSFPCVTAEGRTLLGVARRGPKGEADVAAWTRARTDLPFGRPAPVRFDGIEMPSSPAFFRYCEATHELVFSGGKAGEPGPSLWIIRGFGLPDGR